MTEITARLAPQLSRPLLAALLLLLATAFVVIASGLWPRTNPPLPAQVDIETAATQRFELSGAAYPAVGLDRLWVTAGGAGIAEIDPATGELLRTTQIDGGSCGSIEVAFGRVWTPTCQIGGIAAIDPGATQTAVRFGIPVVDEEATIGVGDDALWVVAGGLADQLVKVDPASLQVADTFPVAPGSTNPEVGFASVWLASKNAGTVVRMDPTTGAVKATIGVGELPRFLAIGEGSVWVVNQADGTVTRINPRFNSVIATIAVGSLHSAGGIEIAGGSVWVRGADNVAQIDPDQNRVVAFYGPAPGDGGIGSDGVSLWITSRDANLVWRLPGN